MNISEIKDFIVRLLNRELEQEYDYQMNGEKDTTYLKSCILAKQYILNRSKKGIDGFINMILIDDDVKNYIKIMEKED